MAGLDMVLKLRELRRLRGLSQKDAARVSGIGEKTISSFETGERIGALKLSQLESLLSAYNVSPGEFFSEELERKIAPWDELIAPAGAEEIFENLGTLSSSVRRALLQKFSLMIETAQELQSIPSTPQPYSREEVDWHMLSSRN